MAFKINNPLTYTDPGKKLPQNPYPGNTTAGLESTKSFKIPAFLGMEDTLEKDKNTVKKFGANERISGEAKKRINIFNSASTTASKSAPLNPSLPIEGPKQEVKFDTGFGESGRSNKKAVDLGKTSSPKDKKQKTIVPPPKETKASGEQSKLSKTNLGKKGNQTKFGEEVTMQSVRKNNKSKPKENTLDAINKVSMKSDKFVPASKKSKEAPKDNSRKAIRKRKQADKAAGVSKSQMRANKAKSKSEAASAKAKKSKNPSYRAQLTAKSERLDKRAKRKGNS